MSGNLGWKIQRLRRMGCGEIVFRIHRALRQFLEEKRIARGWVPELPGEVTTGMSLLPPLTDYREEWSARYRLDTAGLEDVILGKLTLFGHHKIQLGEDHNWHQDPDTGVCAPVIYGKRINYRDNATVGNVKVTWELGRQHHLVPLAVGYAISGDRRYLHAIAIQIESWIEQNPFAMGIHWCSALELALRLLSWSIIHSLVCSRDGDKGLFGAVRDPTALSRSIYQQAWFIRHYLSRHSSANNHLFGELVGLWTACNVFNLGDDGDRWKRQCAAELETQLRLQVFDDGVDKEQALYYHLWMLEYGIFLVAAGRRFEAPFSQGFCNRVGAMADFVGCLTPVGGAPPQIGDSDDGFVTRFTTEWPDNPYGDVLAAVVNVLHGRAGLTQSEKAFWYGLIGKSAITSEHVDNKHSTHGRFPIIFPDGGYAVLGDSVCHLVFDAGSLGYLSIAAHGHADALNVTLALSGEWWLVDPGTYVYHRLQEWRDYFRSTRAHNCVVVDGHDQSIMSGPFMWLYHAKAWISSQGSDSSTRQWVKGCHDGYERLGVKHCREIKLDLEMREIRILDVLEGSGIHAVEVWFQCAPDVQVEMRGEKNVLFLHRPGCADEITMCVDESLALQVIRGQEQPSIAGWYSSRLDHKEPCYAICGSVRVTLPVRLETRISYKLGSGSESRAGNG